MTQKANNDFADQDPETQTEYEFQPGAPTENWHENKFSITLSQSLAKQLHKLAKNEGISPPDLLLELITEAMGARRIEDQKNSGANHLLTRTGYMPTNQPELSYHAFGNNNSNTQSQGNGRSKNNFLRHQQSSNTHNNRYANNVNQSQSSNRNYANNNSSGSNTSNTNFKSPSKK